MAGAKDTAKAIAYGDTVSLGGGITGVVKSIRGRADGTPYARVRCGNALHEVDIRDLIGATKEPKGVATDEVKGNDQPSGDD